MIDTYRYIKIIPNTSWMFLYLLLSFLKTVSGKIFSSISDWWLKKIWWNSFCVKRELLQANWKDTTVIGSFLDFLLKNLNEKSRMKKKFYGNYSKYYINACAMMQIYNLDTKKACTVIPGIELLWNYVVIPTVPTTSKYFRYIAEKIGDLCRKHKALKWYTYRCIWWFCPVCFNYMAVT